MRMGRAKLSPRGVALAAVLIAAAALFLTLGVWQLQRRVWKLDLIATVDRRIHAVPAPAPAPALWPRVDREHDAYRRLKVRGVFVQSAETLVQAVTEKGPGFWVMTPLKTDAGFTLLINRGFVPTELRDPALRAAGQTRGEVIVTGLLRLTEPGGGFLHNNDPVDHRWYSRDVAAIAAVARMGRVAPYFMDADATPNPGGWPLGGLTVVSFRNSHLLYALTWFALAAMVICWGVYWISGGLRQRRSG
jgi:surfeit locus 1 family protein